MRNLRLFVLAACLLGQAVVASGRARADEETKSPAATDRGDSAEKKTAAEKAPKKKPPAPLPPTKPGDLSPLAPSDESGARPGSDGEGALPPVPEGFAEVSMDESAPVKPPLSLLDLHGYLRLRGDLMEGLDLGLPERLSNERGSAYPQFPKPATGKGETLSGANMRFRLEPTINISEDVRITAQIDMLDNLVLGSTPEGYPRSPYHPLVVLSDGQQPPVEGKTAIKDSILVRRAWGEVMTPLGLLRFGRMGSQWGLGLLANDGGPMHVDRGPLVTSRDPFAVTGHCFDCDYGSTADRIMFITKIFDHYVVPMIDFTAEGPYHTYPNEWFGQPFDLDQLDDVNSYILAIAKRDRPEDIRQALAQDDWVLNYGLYFVFRNQALDAVEYQTKSPYEGRDQTVTNYAVRNAETYIPDIWLRFLWGKLRLELEAVMVIGKIGLDAQSGSLDEDGNLIDSADVKGQRIDLLQFGAVLQADYRLLDDLSLGLEIGYASGDESPGFGVRPFDEKQFEHTLGDHDIDNFRFHPDYHVDLILWRQIIGTVTDAFYIKPSVQYQIAEPFGTKLSAIYSSAVRASSTRGKESPLGLELNVDFFYFSGDNFHAGLSYGLLIPFGGMNDLGADELPSSGAETTAENADRDAEVAHRFLGRLVLFF